MSIRIGHESINPFKGDYRGSYNNIISQGTGVIDENLSELNKSPKYRKISDIGKAFINAPIIAGESIKGASRTIGIPSEIFIKNLFHQLPKSTQESFKKAPEKFIEFASDAYKETLDRNLLSDIGKVGSYIPESVKYAGGVGLSLADLLPAAALTRLRKPITRPLKSILNRGLKRFRPKSISRVPISQPKITPKSARPKIALKDIGERHYAQPFPTIADGEAIYPGLHASFATFDEFDPHRFSHWGSKGKGVYVGRNGTNNAMNYLATQRGVLPDNAENLTGYLMDVAYESGRPKSADIILDSRKRVPPEIFNKAIESLDPLLRDTYMKEVARKLEIGLNDPLENGFNFYKSFRKTLPEDEVPRFLDEIGISGLQHRGYHGPADELVLWNPKKAKIKSMKKVDVDKKAWDTFLKEIREREQITKPQKIVPWEYLQ